MYQLTALALLFLAPLQALAIEYVPLENLPFIGGGSLTIGAYALGAFRLLIGVAGILAVVRMVTCGFEAIMSVNPSARETASECVLGAVTGLLLALSAWLILYQINPQLLDTDFVPVTTGTGGGGTTNPPSGGGGASTPPAGGNPAQCDQRNLCQAEASGPSCSQNNALCGQYSAYADEFATARVSADLIREVMAQESSCDVAAGSGVACGLMQLRPGTARQHAGACGIAQSSDITCSWLQNPANARLSVCLGARELDALARGMCGANQRQVIAGYNGGPGACSPSLDCSTQLGCDGRSMSQWECPYDNQAHTQCNSGPASFEETRTYVRRLLRCL